MKVSAKKFIDTLESQELLSPDIVAELRRQVAESKTRLTPQLLAKLLVDNGHLTKFQATKLVSEVSQATEGEPESPTDGAEEELGLAEPDSQPQSNVAEVFLDDEEIVDVEEEVVDVAEVVAADRE